MGHVDSSSPVPSLSTAEKVQETAVCEAAPGEFVSASIVKVMSSKSVQVNSL